MIAQDAQKSHLGALVGALLAGYVVKIPSRRAAEIDRTIIADCPCPGCDASATVVGSQRHSRQDPSCPLIVFSRGHSC